MTIEKKYECAQVVLAEPILSQFEEWLEQRGLILVRILPEEGEPDDEELPTYFPSISPERWAQFAQLMGRPHD